MMNISKSKRILVYYKSKTLWFKMIKNCLIVHLNTSIPIDNEQINIYYKHNTIDYRILIFMLNSLYDLINKYMLR